MSRANIYLELFTALEARLRDRAKITEDYVGFNEVVNLLVNQKRDPIVTRFERDLKSYAALRNAIAHNYSKQPIADPRQDTIDGLKKLVDSLFNPQRAHQIMTPNPVCFDATDELKSALCNMSAKGYTCVPVYEGEKLVGILSERTALRWASEMMNDTEVLLAELKKVGDLVGYLDPIDGNDFDVYAYVKKSEDVYSIQDMFYDAIEAKHRLSAVFVTENGRPAESIIGIITAWDLSRID